MRHRRNGHRHLLRGAIGLALIAFTACGSTITLTATSSSGGTNTTCDPSTLTSYTYLMAFHACSSECSDPSNHTIYMAGSNDGTTWSLISNFTGLAGSVPDIIFYNDFLYLFHAGSTTKSWAKLNACFTVVEEGTATISGTDSGGFVDPSLIQSGTELQLFYLPGVTGADPASCTSYPCTKEIHSATATNSTLTTFTQQSGNRSELSLSSGTFSDPDIVARTDGTYLLYVSSGQSTYVFTGTALSSTFASPDGTTPRAISSLMGGVPSGIEVSNEVWIYVTTNSGGREIIRRAVSSDGTTTLSSSAFTTVLDNSISSNFSSATSVSSPSIITWPGSTWSRAAE
ncbi:MAG: hypothetical protein HY696_11680 [Deltaproteobacteria bacterium]|nr:hypothetical protein [Deltaproteobacteria bacterium]